MRSTRFVSSFPVLFVLACSIGCAVQDTGKKVVKLHEGDQGTFGHADHSGDYVVAWQPVGISRLVTVSPKVHLHKGDPLGFTRDAEVGVVAIAGERRVTVGQVPITAQYLCWYREPDARHQPAGRMVNDVIQKGGDALAFTALVAGAAGLAYAALRLEAALPDDCADADLYRDLSRDHHH